MMKYPLKASYLLTIRRIGCHMLLFVVWLLKTGFFPVAFILDRNSTTWKTPARVGSWQQTSRPLRIEK